MRVLQVCAVDFTAYHFVRPLLHACRDAGWVAEFACADGPFAAILRNEGFRHRIVDVPRSPSAGLIRASLALARDLRRDRPDVVHTHTPAGGLAGRVAAVLAGVPTIVHTLHGLPFAADRPSVLERAYIVAERVLAPRTHLFLSVAAGDVDRAIRLGIARPGRTVAVGNGVDLDRFAPDPSKRALARERLGLSESHVVAAYVGRLVREKGVLDLADAAVRARDMQDLYILVVGGALRSDRTDATALLDFHPAGAMLGDRWQRLGYRSDVDAILAAADIFVLPSYREGLPVSLIEAMATGLPVIATDIPGCRELVEDGVNGVLFSPGDVAALERAIRALGGDANLRARMGERGRATARARHDQRQIVAREVGLIASVASM